MRKGLASIIVGTALLIVTVAGFVIVPEHRPSARVVEKPQSVVGCGSDVYTPSVPGGPTCFVSVPTGLSRTAYDVLLIATWAVMIIGALLIVVGVITYARR